MAFAGLAYPFCRVKALIHYEMHLLKLQLIQKGNHACKGAHIFYTPWINTGKYRKPRILPKKHCQIDLREIFMVTVISVFDIIDQFGP